MFATADDGEKERGTAAEYPDYRVFQRQKAGINKEEKETNHRAPQQKSKPAGEVGELSRRNEFLTDAKGMGVMNYVFAGEILNRNSGALYGSLILSIASFAAFLTSLLYGPHKIISSFGIIS